MATVRPWRTTDNSDDFQPSLLVHHLFRIIKRGTAVTLQVDADNDGETADDGEFTLPDIKDALPKLNDKNSNLFFGGGGLYQNISLSAGPGEK